MGLQIGFPEILIEKFSDSAFTIDPVNKLTITPNDFDSADESTGTVAKDITTLVRGSGGKEVFENPNESSGVFNMTLLNPVADKMQEFLFPDSIKTIDGAKIKRELFDSPGQSLSEFDKMVKLTIKPLGPDKLPLPANNWLVLPRAVMVPTLTDSFSSTPGKTEVQIISLGGRDAGTVGIVTGSVDLLPSVDLSIGAPQLVDVTIDGTLYPNIDVTGAAPASTTGTEIIDAINTAVGTIVATLDTSDFLVISGITAGQTVIIDDPTAGTTAFVNIFGGVAPATNTGTAPFNIPVQVRGDETAV